MTKTATKTTKKTATKVSTKKTAKKPAKYEHTNANPNKLEKVFRKNKQTYTQVKRGKKAVIYQQTNEEGFNVGYEVFMIKIQKAFGFVVNHYPAREKIPGNEAFGKWAWSVDTEEKALEYFNMIENGTIKARKKKK